MNDTSGSTQEVRSRWRINDDALSERDCADHNAFVEDGIKMERDKIETGISQGA